MPSVVPVGRHKDILSMSSSPVSSHGWNPRKADQPSGLKTWSDTQQHSDVSGSDSVIDSKDYHYIMSTSVSDLASSPSPPKSSPRRGHKASSNTQTWADISFNPVDTKFISGASSSPSHKLPRESTRLSASSSRSHHSSPRQYARAADKADDCSNTSPSKSPSPVPRSPSGSRYSVWSSEILSSFSSSHSESVFDPLAKDHLQPRPSPRNPSVDGQFPVAETISEISLANTSDESWFTGSRASNSFQQEELRVRKLMLDQAWASYRQQSLTDWVSSVHAWEDDVASNLGTESLMTRLKTRVQSTWWRLTRGRETRVQTIKKSNSGYGGGTSGGDEDKTTRREKLQKRVQKFISRVFICGEQTQV